MPQSLKIILGVIALVLFGPFIFGMAVGFYYLAIGEEPPKFAQDEPETVEVVEAQPGLEAAPVVTPEPTPDQEPATHTAAEPRTGRPGRWDDFDVARRVSMGNVFDWSTETGLFTFDGQTWQPVPEKVQALTAEETLAVHAALDRSLDEHTSDMGAAFAVIAMQLGVVSELSEDLLTWRNVFPLVTQAGLFQRGSGGWVPVPERVTATSGALLKKIHYELGRSSADGTDEMAAALFLAGADLSPEERRTFGRGTGLPGTTWSRGTAYGALRNTRDSWSQLAILVDRVRTEPGLEPAVRNYIEVCESDQLSVLMSQLNVVRMRHGDHGPWEVHVQDKLGHLESATLRMIHDGLEEGWFGNNGEIREGIAELLEARGPT